MNVAQAAANLRRNHRYEHYVATTLEPRPAGYPRPSDGFHSAVIVQGVRVWVFLFEDERDHFVLSLMDTNHKAIGHLNLAEAFGREKHAQSKN